ncbi:unnamed protein product [Periconia digitata]|uniref:Protein with SprT-like domain at the N terminus n=1 Tax=Periconia digitata TaxID=1303443 RepID=A0A9W4XP71_9PLEO|nr:unnamed protein product [Periconia digitata]
MPVTDEDAAIQAIATLENLSTKQTEALQAVNTILQSDDPFVDVHQLFKHYNVLYFRGILLPRVELLWSPRLTLCAGICELSKDPVTGTFTRIRLKLSSSLLQYRPRSDTINTLLHEAIHAYFFITTSWHHSRGDDGTGHGAGFQFLADAINNHGRYAITIFHTFHDEVDSFRTHVWKCNGTCQNRPPYFGVVKRSMNRAPGKSDPWWADHERECGGTYVKVSEPEVTKKQRDAMSLKKRAGLQKNKLDGWVKVGAGAGKGSVEEGNISSSSVVSSGKRGAAVVIAEDDTPDRKRRRRAPGDDGSPGKPAEKKMMVDCPICYQRVPELDINEHLDVAHHVQ